MLQLILVSDNEVVPLQLRQLQVLQLTFFVFDIRLEGFQPVVHWGDRVGRLDYRGTPCRVI